MLCNRHLRQEDAMINFLPTNIYLLPSAFCLLRFHFIHFQQILFSRLPLPIC